MRIDLTGQKFGRLTVIGVSRCTEKNLYWKVKCDCGAIREHFGLTLRNGVVVSCGCYHKEIMTKHGHAPHFTTGRPTPEYRSWDGMKDRCYNQKNPAFFRYGGRRITVCERWRESFQNFLSDMGLRPFPSATIDRINNDGNYEPSNCRWATKDIQSQNRRKRTHYRGKPIKKRLVNGRYVKVA